MIVSTRAIPLSHIRYGESSIVVHLYTERLGRLSIFVQSAYGKRTQTRQALFQPLSLLETDIHHRASRQMQRISNIRLLQTCSGIFSTPVKNGIALFIAEIIYKTLREEESNPGLFAFLTHAIETLDLMEHGVANFHLLFMVHLSRYLGFYPNVETLPDDVPVLFRQLLGLTFESLAEMELSRGERNYLTDYLLDYYSIHVENLGKIRSFEVLKNVFN